MADSVLLDTNIVIAATRRDARVNAEFALAKNVFVPAIVVGELLYGAHNAQHPFREFAKVEAFLTSLDESAILPCDHATGQVYGWLKFQCTSIGRPIPENDYWIAALAYQYDLTLVTRDGHFRDIRGLDVASW